MKKLISIVLPTFNEKENIQPIVAELLELNSEYDLEILVVDDDSPDGTAEAVRKLAKKYKNIRLIRRVGRNGLASAIKEGILDATGDIVISMDCDGQHEPQTVAEAIKHLIQEDLELVMGSRFHTDAIINGLTSNREKGSTYANNLARWSLSPRYANLSDFMTGFFALHINEKTLRNVRAVEVHGFKFIYELLSVSKGSLKVSEVPLHFQARASGNSKLDVAILWDFLVSVIHTFCARTIPRRAISFGIVGISGVFVQLFISQLLTISSNISFESALPIAVITAACSNYLINNFLTFRSNRLKGLKLAKGLLKFLIVSSLPIVANVGLATAFYSAVASNTILAQLVGIIVGFTWNYVASSKFVWNTP